MAVLPKCPSCGLESEEVRCPRCNTLKVLGCSGSCTFCKTSTECAAPTAPEKASSCGSKPPGEAGSR